MKGKLPITGECVLESCEEQWRLLISGVLTEIRTSALIDLPDGRKAKIKIRIISVIPPEQISVHAQAQSYFPSFEKTVSDCLTRIDELVIKKAFENKWILLGYIEQDLPIPIGIYYIPLMNIFLYSQQRKDDQRKLMENSYIFN